MARILIDGQCRLRPKSLIPWTAEILANDRFAGAAIGAAAVLYFNRPAFSLKLVGGHAGSAI